MNAISLFLQNANLQSTKLESCNRSSAECAAQKKIFDNGNAYMAGDNSVFEAYGMKHVFYPPEIHQFFSSNDNKLHGVAKRIWRTSDIDHKDDVLSSIMLMHIIDNVSATIVSGWFKQNLCLGAGRLTKKLAEKVVGGQPGRR